MQTFLKAPAGLLFIALAALLSLTGCGHSEEEWQQAPRDFADGCEAQRFLNGVVHETEDRRPRTEDELRSAAHR